MTRNESDLPQHRRLYEILKGHIRKGMYQEGDLLPSENALCQTYGLTRPTVRQALKNLVVDGFIKRQQGKGSIVQKKKEGIGILAITGTTDSVHGHSLETRVIAQPTIGPWPGDNPHDITEEEEQSGCIRLERLRLIDGQPILYEITYLPNINLPRFCSRSFENKSLFETLQTYYDLKITGGEQRIWALPAAGSICSYLDVAKDVPILHLLKKYETCRPYYHFYASLWCNTQDYYLQGPF